MIHFEFTTGDYVINPETGESEQIDGWEYIAMTMLNTMKKGYAKGIGSETDQHWLDIYEQTLRAQLDPALADDAIAIAKEAARAKDAGPQLVDDKTGHIKEGLVCDSFEIEMCYFGEVRKPGPKQNTQHTQDQGNTTHPPKKDPRWKSK